MNKFIYIIIGITLGTIINIQASAVTTTASVGVNPCNQCMEVCNEESR